MRTRQIAKALTLAALALGMSAPSAGAEFGLETFDVTATDAKGDPVTQAGAHPHEFTTTLEVNTTAHPSLGTIPDEALKDGVFPQMLGFVGDPTAVPTCSTLEFLDHVGVGASCSDSSVVGITTLQVGTIEDAPVPAPVYLLEKPPGVAAKLGFWAINVPVTIEATLSQNPPYRIVATTTNVSQLIPFFASEFTLWGHPGDPAHDEDRGSCTIAPAGQKCPANVAAKPFITMPRACQGPLTTDYAVDSWVNPGKWVTGSATTHDAAGNPQGFLGCGKLGFDPEVTSLPTADSAETGTGLDFDLRFQDEGLKSPAGLAASESKKAVVTLPEGVTINPSVGEGLGVCTPADLERETLASKPGEGCPNSSKIGSLLAETPIVDQPVPGSIFLAQQDDPKTTAPGVENPFDSLIALYFVLRNPDLGVIIKLPVLVEPDPVTGQLQVTLDDAPQIPISHFNAHLREGQRAALVTPARCGTYTVESKFYPWSDPEAPRTVSSSFQVTRGVGGGPCPPGGVPPFAPAFEAGAINNNAGSSSPFNMRLQRADGEQDMTKFSSILPPGQIGSLVGVAKCPDTAVEAAKQRSGRDELASPSCPQSSEIGRTQAGAGVGAALTYVEGKLYLAGPYKGAPLSVVSVTPAVAGPFDAGTVVVRLALTLNSKTAEVEVDGAASDPIPHILKGIVLKVRDLQVYVDRPGFLRNPTSCDESQTRATLFGSFLDVLSPHDDVPAALSSRYQAAGCAALAFKPRLGLKLKGGTRRGGHPGLIATYRPRNGDANIEDLVTRLPRSAFLDQAHIRTICTRVQFAAKACPKGAQYGYIRAFTPLLEEPLQGPVWLRSSNNKLPDLVFDLRGIVDVEVAVRIDSARGGIRATLEDAPDAPLSKVVLRMQGGKKGLIINSRNLCLKPKRNRANLRFTGHNGKRTRARPVMRADCKKKRKAKRSAHRRVR